MRIKFAKFMLIFALIGNIIILHRIWKLFSLEHSEAISVLNPTIETPQKLHRRLARLVTVIIRQYESFENDISTTVKLILNSYPSMTVIIVCDDLIYPPLEIDFKNKSMKNVHLVNLLPSFNKTLNEKNPISYVQTKYVLFLPDSTRLLTKQNLQVYNLKKLFLLTISLSLLYILGSYFNVIKIGNGFSTSRKKSFDM